MDSNNQARQEYQGFKPNIVADFHALKSMEDEEDAKKMGVDPEDHALFYLSRLKGWRVIEDFINQLKRELDTMMSSAIASGLSREEIGDRAVLASLTKEALEKILQKVADAKEAVEQTK